MTQPIPGVISSGCSDDRLRAAQPSLDRVDPRSRSSISSNSPDVTAPRSEIQLGEQLRPARRTVSHRPDARRSTTNARVLSSSVLTRCSRHQRSRSPAAQSKPNHRTNRKRQLATQHRPCRSCTPTRQPLPAAHPTNTSHPYLTSSSCTTVRRSSTQHPPPARRIQHPPRQPIQTVPQRAQMLTSSPSLYQAHITRLPQIQTHVQHQRFTLPSKTAITSHLVRSHLLHSYPPHPSYPLHHHLLRRLHRAGEALFS